MLEGLWVVEFLAPESDEFDLNGGVAVIESGRILGGDSGYVYLGNIAPEKPTGWSVRVTIRRHDPNIYSVFGDLDEYALQGAAEVEDDAPYPEPCLIARLANPDSPIELVVRLKKVAELP